MVAFAEIIITMGREGFNSFIDSDRSMWYGEYIFDEKEVSYGLQIKSSVRQRKEDSGKEDDSEKEKIRRSFLQNPKRTAYAVLFLMILPIGNLALCFCCRPECWYRLTWPPCLFQPLSMFL